MDPAIWARAKPLKTARAEAERAVETFRFAAAEARTMAGDMVPLDATATGVGKLGFYGHTDVDTKQRAEAAGFDLVVPRSRMAREMATLVERVAA